MARRQSEQVDRALALMAQGVNPWAAAVAVGIAPSTIYRARKRMRTRNLETKPKGEG